MNSKLQAVNKRVSLSECHRDQAVAELFIADRLDRISSWATLKVLLKQVDDLGIRNAWSRSSLASDVVVRRLVPPTEFRVEGDGPAVASVVENGSRVCRQIIPRGFDVRSQLMITHVIDRGSSGAAPLYYACGAVGKCWCIRNGIQHDLCNAAKTAGKKHNGAMIWKSVIKFSSVQNLPYGPFRSGAWGRLMQDEHLGSTESLD